mgnify:CR=1 FL=1
MEAKYTSVDEFDAMGACPKFKGPGISQYDRGVHIMQPINDWATKHVDDDFAKRETDRVVYLLNLAYEAGRQSMAKDLRNLLGAVAVERR